jgi:hypothetical protein
MWRCLGTAFGHFLLGSHNFTVTAFGLCVKWPLVKIFHVWGPTWTWIHWNIVWLRARSCMASHYTWGSVTTLHDVGGELRWPSDTFFWALTISWSRLLAHVWSHWSAPNLSMDVDFSNYEKLVHGWHIGPPVWIIGFKKYLIEKNRGGACSGRFHSIEKWASKSLASKKG